MTKIKTIEQSPSDSNLSILLHQLVEENPGLKQIIDASRTVHDFKQALKTWAMRVLEENPGAVLYYSEEKTGTEQVKALRFRDFAAIRILDYIEHSGRQFKDLSAGGQIVETDPFSLIWAYAKAGAKTAAPSFLYDMIHLFRQFSGRHTRVLPSKKQICEWMNDHPSGLDEAVIEQRKKNKARILALIIEKIDSGIVKSNRFMFKKNLSWEEKFALAETWWTDYRFHLKFAARTPRALNEMLGHSLDRKTLDRLDRAQAKGIPFFINPYYCSLLNTDPGSFCHGKDLAIRQYVFYSEELIQEFGNIVAWEKEDVVQPGKPNAAGWIIPDDAVHRRYPNVAILIPETMGRACGGLCSVCQRMYGFQRGNLNFDLEKLKAKKFWEDRFEQSLRYFETDSQLRDILITGGDALMSTNSSLKKILDRVYQMAKRKIKANESRKDGEKYAQIIRVRLGTRLPVYLPMRIDPELVNIFADFKHRASQIGIRQFIFQTHVESSMEITPETRDCIKQLNAAGWMVINQLVFTSAASRRGHAAKLRKTLNDIGILPYYCFTVKGYMENYSSYTPNSRSVQESIEEKSAGQVPNTFHDRIARFHSTPATMKENIFRLKQDAGLLFLATDRNVLNLPGVGKSLTFRTIGITKDGRRILEFDHDVTRKHSPIIKKMGKIVIIELKSIYDYLQQLSSMGEDPDAYSGVYGYSLSRTEARQPIYEYPLYDYGITQKITHLEIPDV